MELFLTKEHTTPDLYITAGIITTGFVRIDSDVPSLPVMSLKMKKIIGAGLKPAVKDNITAGWQQTDSVVVTVTAG